LPEETALKRILIIAFALLFILTSAGCHAAAPKSSASAVGTSAKPTASLSSTLKASASITPSAARTLTPILSVTPEPSAEPTAEPTPTPEPTAPPATAEPDPTPESPDNRGNSAGNLANVGMVAQQGDWIYFVNTSDKWMLYKVNINGTGKVKISDDSASYLNVYGDWIYYANFTDGDKLYRIRTDGTARTALISDAVDFVSVVNDVIYVTDKFLGHYLFRMNLDATGLTLISTDSCMDVNVVGSHIYYTGYPSDMNPANARIIRIKTDGSEKTLLHQSPSERLAVSGIHMYFKHVQPILNSTEDMIPYSALVNGASVQRLCDDRVRSINAEGDWMYYKDEKDSLLYRVRYDGTGKMKVGECPQDYFYILGDRIAIQGGTGLILMNTDGTDVRSL
jgi:hypothetical protein